MSLAINRSMAQTSFVPEVEGLAVSPSAPLVDRHQCPCRAEGETWKNAFALVYHILPAIDSKILHIFYKKIQPYEEKE
ncbi:MAG: hypothetical protein HFF86_01070 [Oscillibacter sp.]|nr:hypothetical protein [Oscillibacter sp.]